MGLGGVGQMIMSDYEGGSVRGYRKIIIDKEKILMGNVSVFESLKIGKSLLIVRQPATQEWPS